MLTMAKINFAASLAVQRSIQKPIKYEATILQISKIDVSFDNYSYIINGSYQVLPKSTMGGLNNLGHFLQRQAYCVDGTSWMEVRPN